MSVPVKAASPLPAPAAEPTPAAAEAEQWDAQHPRNPDGTWQAHCNVCGVYVDDEPTRPAADFLCDECQEAGEDEG